MSAEEELQAAADESDPEAFRWTFAALCIGYNELAKQAPELVSKVYFRLMRDSAEERFIAAGGQKFFTPEEPAATLEVGVAMPVVKFRHADIELMRKLVADHDAALTQDASPSSCPAPEGK